MKVVIFGATGGIGQHAVKHCIDQGNEVVAYVRNKNRVKLVNPNLTIIEGELNDYNKIELAIANSDAVIIAIGIPMKFSYPNMLSLEGHKNIIKAMQTHNVKRLIDWSTPSIHSEIDKKSFITVVPGIMAGIVFPKAKKELLAIAELITTSDLDWTIVRFMAPKDTPFTNQVKVGFGDTKMNFNISRSDIANFMVEQLTNPEYIHKMPIIGS